MRSDVPFGAFLSGGIDSSLVVACMSEFSDQPVETFNVSFTETEFDESGHAAQIAALYKTNHHRITLRPQVFLDAMDDILGAMDTPSGDGPNTYIVAKHTRAAGIKVALSGLGGDELFAGYPKFLMYYKLMRRKWIAKLPVPMRKGAGALLSAIKNDQQSGKLHQLLSLPHWKWSSVYPLLRQAYRLPEANAVLHRQSNQDIVTQRLDAMSESIGRMGHFSHATIAEMETYTRDVLLRDTDQMAMAHALEVRVPFFDYRLMEYVLALPDSYKYPHTPKQLLVEALAPRLPEAIVHRPKMGFTLPFERWLRNELYSFAEQKIQSLADRREFNSDAVLDKWSTFQRNDPRVVWSRVWQLVVLSDWLERNKL
jgi:asparagine synthase (glutamine-hydrolysing)